MTMTNKQINRIRTTARVTAIRTGPEYVRYSYGHDKWYRAVIEQRYETVRVSRHIFDRASDAVAYRTAFLARLARLRACQSQMAEKGTK